MKIAHFGTFDVENYGDLLFPLILERRLSDLGQRFVHVSPRGGPPVWGDCVPSVAAENLLDDSTDVNAVVVGGGHIVHASPTSLDHYDQGGVSQIVAYASLWLGAAYIAAQQNLPLCWNAPGVPKAFTPTGSRLVHWAASVTDYLAVRDRAGRRWLADAGVPPPIHVVPDTALEVSRLWSEEEVDAAYASAFTDRGRPMPERTLAFHLNSRFIAEEIETLAARIDRICQQQEATAILIAIGPCHGDDELQRRVAGQMTTGPLVVDQPQSLREVAACIARSDAYLGSSLHGLVTACSFGKPGIVVIPPTAGTHHKFVGFLERFQLTRWLCESWDQAEHSVDELLAAPIGAWQRVLPAAMPILDEHWDRLRAALGASEDQGQPVSSIDKQAALARFPTLDGRYGASSHFFAEIIAEQAQRAMEAGQAAQEHRRKMIEAQKAYDRVREKLSATERAAEHEGQRASALEMTHRSERETLQQRLDEGQRRVEELEASHRAELESLRRQVEQEAAHRAELEALRRQVEREEQRREVELEAVRRQAELETVQRRLDEAQRRHADLEAAHVAERETLQQRLAQEQERLVEREAAHRADREALGQRLKNDAQTYRAEHETLQQRLESEQQRLAEMEEDHRTKQAAVAQKLTEQEAAHKAERESLQQRHVEQEAAHRTELEGLRRRLTDLEAQGRRARQEAQRRLDEQEVAHRAELEAAHQAEQEALRQWLSEEESARQRLDDAERRQVQLEAAYRAEREDLQQRLGDAETARKAELEAADQKLTELKAVRRAEREELQQRLGDAQRRLDEKVADKPEFVSATSSRSANGNGSVPPSAEPVAASAQGTEVRGAATADVIICVHNALDDVKLCLASLVRHTDARHRVIIVDDGSDAECHEYLMEFARGRSQCVLIRNDQAQGYTKAANQGLRHSSAELVVLLNSDTIVTPQWLERLVECAQSDPKVGIVGPLSNAAGYQSIPERFASSGGWAVNPPPPGWSADQVADAVATISNRVFPRAALINGFCFLIKREVIDVIGLFDEEGFPEGYGEEYDYCLRAAAAGFELAVADHAYVFHAKSRSYSPERRRSLVEAGNSVLFRTYGRERIEAGVTLLREEPTLVAIRQAIGRHLDETSPAPAIALADSPTEMARAAVPTDASRVASHDLGQSPSSNDVDSLAHIVLDNEVNEMKREMLDSNGVIQGLRQQLATLALNPAGSQQQGSAAATQADSSTSMEEELQEILLHLCDQLLRRADVLESIITTIEVNAAKEPKRQLSRVTPAIGSKASMEGERRPWNGAPAVIRRHSGNGRMRKPRPRVTVIAWDVTHNPLGRAYLLADMLRTKFDVQLVGAKFPRYGTDIWEPLRESNVPIIDFKGHQFPHHFTVMQRTVESLRPDVVLVSKPRLPSYELGILMKLRQSCPLILDIDDYELSFFRDRSPLTLKQVRENPRNDDFLTPHGSMWTRYCESIIPLADSITTSSEALRQKYGGLVVPHARDENVFDPVLYDRDAMRARYGYGPDDRVILFLGTPRTHKGVMEIIAALRRLDQPHYKVCIIGNVVDHDLKERLKAEGGPFVQLVPNISFADIAAHLVIGDLICLLQDRHSEIAKFQTPAKLTDALAMAVPILATDAGPLSNLAARGLVEPLGSSPLGQRIHEIFSNYDSFKRKAVQNREVFLSEYSYASNGDRLEQLINELRENPRPAPPEYEELVRFHREEFLTSRTRATSQISLQETHSGLKR